MRIYSPKHHGSESKSGRENYRPDAAAATTSLIASSSSTRRSQASPGVARSPTSLLTLGTTIEAATRTGQKEKTSTTITLTVKRDNSDLPDIAKKGMMLDKAINALTSEGYAGSEYKIESDSGESVILYSNWEILSANSGVIRVHNKAADEEAARKAEEEKKKAEEEAARKAEEEKKAAEEQAKQQAEQEAQQQAAAEEAARQAQQHPEEQRAAHRAHTTHRHRRARATAHGQEAP